MRGTAFASCLLLTVRHQIENTNQPMERRKAEIAAKQAKLAELRKAREARTASALSSAAPSRPASTLGTETERPLGSRGQLDDILTDLLGGVGASADATMSGKGTSTSPSRSSSIAGLDSPVPRFGGVSARDGGASGRTSRASEELSASGGASSLEGNITAVPLPEVIATPPPLESTPLSQPPPLLPPAPVLPPPPPKVLYDKGIQASLYNYPDGPLPPNSFGISTTDDSTITNGTAGGAGRESAEEMRARIIAELEAERKQLDLEIEEEKRKAELELELERAKGLAPPALSNVLGSPQFLDFLSHSSKIVQRALSDSYDYLRDYTVSNDEENAETAGASVRLLGSWYEERWGRGRSVTGVDWSPKFPELFVASYNKNPMAVNEPDGIACVWNLHLQERPEFVFHAQSDVLSVSFTPFHPNLVIGGTYSGQILLWDTRSRHPNPVLKTPLSASGHTHPVYSLSMVGTQNAHNLISASTDGTVCAWTLDLLARPQETLELLHPAHNKTDEVSVTTLGFPQGETTTFWVGTEEGNVYSANRYDRAGAKAGLVQSEVYKGHSGPVTGIDFHPVAGTVDLSDLFLTCGVDWTVKLWRAGGSAGVAASKAAQSGGASSTSIPNPVAGAGIFQPLCSFEEADDYVYDVKWHPNHPALFGSVDGGGKFDIWNLNVDTEVPIVSTAVAPSASRGLNKLAWDRREGRKAAIGSSDGRVYVYEISQELATPREGEGEQVRKTCNALGMGSEDISGGGGGR